MSQPTVSIVIPAYNPSAEQLKRCMESVLRQSYQEIEVLLVDDGSIPQVAAAIQEWEGRDGRVQVAHQSNSGVGSARNYGISLAHGKYICFVDVDDYITDYWLEKTVGMAEDNDADIVYGRVCMVDVMPKQPIQKDDTVTKLLVYESSDRWRVQEMFLLNNTSPFPDLPYLDFGPCGKLFRMRIAKQILFPTDLPLAEDQVFNHAALHQSERLIITNIPAYYYILNKVSATHRSRANAVEIMLDAMKEIQKYLFPVPEVRNAYDYRLIIEVLVGIQMAHFYDVNDRCSLHKKYIIMKKIFTADPVRAAVQDIRLDSSIRAKERFKIRLFKHHIYGPFVLVWTLRLKLKQIQARMKR